MKSSHSVVKKFILLIGVIALAQNAQGSFETRNGGYGVVLGDKIYSYDLYQASVHLEPFLSPGGSIALTDTEDAAIEALLRRVSLDAETLAITKDKLGDLKQRLAGSDLPFSELLAKAQTFRWLAIDASCIDVQDEQDPMHGKVQVAYREDIYIRFCEDFFRLDHKNQAAVILHETIYTVSTHLKTVLEFTGYLFGSPGGDFANLLARLLTAVPTGADLFISLSDHDLRRSVMHVREGYLLGNLQLTSTNPFLSEGFGLPPSLIGRTSYAQAEEYCARLYLDGYGWRLPTIAEARILAEHELAAIEGYNAYVWYKQQANGRERMMNMDTGQLTQELVDSHRVVASAFCVRWPQ